MSTFDIVIRGGTVATATQSLLTDVGITGGKVAALGLGLKGAKEIGATGKLVLPGGVDSHVHIDQLSSFGIPGADDCHSVTVSGAVGGTTPSIQRCAQPGEDAHAKVAGDVWWSGERAGRTEG